MHTAHAVPPPAARLPSGRQFAATWAIPENYGGMTSALLHRSRIFARAGSPVDILTFDPRPYAARLRTELDSRGELIEGVRLRNIYEHFRLHASEPGALAVRPAPTPSRAPDEVIRGDGEALLWNDGGQAVRREHRRADGTLAVVDERRDDTGRIITVCGFDSSPLRQWSGASAFYFAWLDELIRSDPAFVIVDSKTMAPTLRGYPRAHVAMIHVVHGSHLSRGSEPRVTRSRAPILQRLRDWDAVAFLTSGQKTDVADLFGDPGNLVVAPNAVTVPEPAPPAPDRFRGAIVARLVRAKRLDHAFRIIAAARRLGAPVTLDVYGEGDDRPRLEREITSLGIGDAVRLRGYTDDPAKAYAEASFTLLTSTSEGESLALLEAMANGCLPVAYDVRYGPSDTIDDGRNGRLVADGDTEAAAAALVGLCGLSQDQAAQWRVAARSRASEHSDDRTLARWGEIEQAARERRAARPVPGRIPGAPERGSRGVAAGIARRLRRLLT